MGCYRIGRFPLRKLFLSTLSLLTTGRIVHRADRQSRLSGVNDCYTMLYGRGGLTLLRFFESAFKHNLSKDQILQALADPFKIYEELQDDEEGNPQDLTIGKTCAEVILEVGVKYRDDEDCVFHADEANAKRKDAYNLRR